MSCCRRDRQLRHDNEGAGTSEPNDTGSLSLLVSYEFEARLALAQVLPDSARPPKLLNDLERDARAKGFLLIAEKAEKIRR